MNLWIYCYFKNKNDMDLTLNETAFGSATQDKIEAV